MPKNSRHLCLTIPQVNGEPKFDPQIMYYLCYGLEKGPATGYLHYQSYVEFKEETSFKEVHKCFGPCHISIRRGNKLAAIIYCKKDGVFTEHGEPEKQGQRNDISAMMSQIKEGKSTIEVAETFTGTWAHCYRAMAIYKDLLESKNQKRDCKITAIVGKPGTGKSTLAMLLAPQDVYYKTLEGNWYDGYTGQKTIILDEFREGVLTLKNLLTLVSPIPIRLPTKGSSTPCKAEHFIIISNYHPTEWFGKLDETSTEALNRRIETYIDIKKCGAATLLPAPPPPTVGVRPYWDEKWEPYDIIYWDESRFWLAPALIPRTDKKEESIKETD